MATYERSKAIGETIARIINREQTKNADFGEAFFVVDLDNVRWKLQRWRRVLPRVVPHYAVKCNDDHRIIATLADMGGSFDCASEAEIRAALNAGVSTSRVIYAHTIKHPNYIKFASAVGVDLMTVDCEEELQKIKALHSAPRLLIRIQCNHQGTEFCLNRQYGCPQNEVPSVLAVAKELELEIVGVSFHVGSGVSDGQVYAEAIDDANKVFIIAREMGFSFTTLDIGGGFYGNSSPPVDFEETASSVRKSLDALFPPERGVDLISEPGRYFVSSCTTLVMTVIGKKFERANKTIEPGESLKRMYFVNDGIHGSITPALPFVCRAETLSVVKTLGDTTLYSSSVWGPTCDSRDCIFPDCQLPELEIGDWVYLENMGAYIRLHHGSAFNGMPGPRSVYVHLEKKCPT